MRRNLQDISILIFFSLLCEGGFSLSYMIKVIACQRQGVDLLWAPPWLRKMLDGCGTMDPREAGEDGSKKTNRNEQRRTPSFEKWEIIYEIMIMIMIEIMFPIIIITVLLLFDHDTSEPSPTRVRGSLTLVCLDRIVQGQSK